MDKRENNEGIIKFQKLVKAISKGKKRAFENFFDVYGKLIFYAAKSVCGEDELSEEVVDDVLVKVWKMSDSLLSIENPEGWLYVVSVNCAKDKRTLKWGSLDENYPDSTDYYEKVLSEDVFYRLIEDLTDSEQQILILKFVQDKTFQEIADITQKPLASVSYTYYRALETIKSQSQG